MPPLIYGVGDEVLVFLFGFGAACSLLGVAAWVILKRPNNGPARQFDEAFRRQAQARPRVIAPEDASQPVRPRPRIDAANPGLCPICITAMDGESVTTNCGHTFDLECLLAYWAHLHRRSNFACACCRQRITIIFPNFDEASSVGASQRVMQCVARRTLH